MKMQILGSLILLATAATHAAGLFNVTTTNTTWIEANSSCALASVDLKHFSEIVDTVNVTLPTDTKIWLGYVTVYHDFENIGPDGCCCHQNSTRHFSGLIAGCLELNEDIKVQPLYPFRGPSLCFAVCGRGKFFGLYNSSCYCFNGNPPTPDVQTKCGLYCDEITRAPCGGYDGDNQYMSLYQEVNVSETVGGGLCRSYYSNTTTKMFVWEKCSSWNHALCNDTPVWKSYSRYLKWYAALWTCYGQRRYPLYNITEDTEIPADVHHLWTAMFKDRVIYQVSESANMDKYVFQYGYLQYDKSINQFRLWFTNNKDEKGVALCNNTGTTADRAAVITTTVTSDITERHNNTKSPRLDKSTLSVWIFVSIAFGILALLMLIGGVIVIMSRRRHSKYSFTNQNTATSTTNTGSITTSNAQLQEYHNPAFLSESDSHDVSGDSVNINNVENVYITIGSDSNEDNHIDNLDNMNNITDSVGNEDNHINNFDNVHNTEDSSETDQKHNCDVSEDVQDTPNQSDNACDMTQVNGKNNYDVTGNSPIASNTSHTMSNKASDRTSNTHDGYDISGMFFSKPNVSDNVYNIAKFTSNDMNDGYNTTGVFSNENKTSDNPYNTATFTANDTKDGYDTSGVFSNENKTSDNVYNTATFTANDTNDGYDISGNFPIEANTSGNAYNIATFTANDIKDIYDICGVTPNDTNTSDNVYSCARDSDTDRYAVCTSGTFPNNTFVPDTTYNKTTPNRNANSDGYDKCELFQNGNISDNLHNSANYCAIDDDDDDGDYADLDDLEDSNCWQSTENIYTSVPSRDSKQNDIQAGNVEQSEC